MLGVFVSVIIVSGLFPLGLPLVLVWHGLACCSDEVSPMVSA